MLETLQWLRPSVKGIDISPRWYTPQVFRDLIIKITVFKFVCLQSPLTSVKI